MHVRQKCWILDNKRVNEPGRIWWRRWLWQEVQELDDLVDVNGAHRHILCHLEKNLDVSLAIGLNNRLNLNIWLFGFIEILAIDILRRLFLNLNRAVYFEVSCPNNWLEELFGYFNPYVVQVPNFWFHEIPVNVSEVHLLSRVTKADWLVRPKLYWVIDETFGQHVWLHRAINWRVRGIIVLIDLSWVHLLGKELWEQFKSEQLIDVGF